VSAEDRKTEEEERENPRETKSLTPRKRLGLQQGVCLDDATRISEYLRSVGSLVAEVAEGGESIEYPEVRDPAAKLLEGGGRQMKLFPLSSED